MSVACGLIIGSRRVQRQFVVGSSPAAAASSLQESCGAPAAAERADRSMRRCAVARSRVWRRGGNCARAAAARLLPTSQLRSGAVERVADHRMMQRREVDANLVRAPGVQLHFDERGRVDARKDAPVRAGLARVREARRCGARSYARAAWDRGRWPARCRPWSSLNKPSTRAM